MKPESRTQLSWIVAIVPLLFLSASSGTTKILVSVSEAMIRDRKITGLPGPTRLLLEHRLLASVFPLVLALALVAAIWYVKRRSQDEASSRTIELVVHTLVWFVAANYVVGVLIAAFLPAGIPATH
ncbi:MAG TPA: hypothetical protein VHD32_09520 [Candidatus Didemnitutus sp.]|nr:hypothetical protein [Candidatus Didemnitutus sp.]